MKARVPQLAGRAKKVSEAETVDRRIGRHSVDYPAVAAIIDPAPPSAPHIIQISQIWRRWPSRGLRVFPFPSDR